MTQANSRIHLYSPLYFNLIYKSVMTCVNTTSYHFECDRSLSPPLSILIRYCKLFCCFDAAVIFLFLDDLVFYYMIWCVCVYRLKCVTLKYAIKFHINITLLQHHHVSKWFVSLLRALSYRSKCVCALQKF